MIATSRIDMRGDERYTDREAATDVNDMMQQEH
jgi:hypothetical protein